MKSLTLALSMSLALMLTSLAEAKDRRHKRVTRPSAIAQAQALGSQPARMIEIRPGYWISSYGCAQDAGYGRFTPCDLTDGNSR